MRNREQPSAPALGFFFSSRRRHTRCSRDWSQTCALPIWVAQRVTVRTTEGDLDVYNAHLGLGGEVLRSAQAQRLLDWMDGRRPGPAVLMGDLNARPGSPTIELLSGRLRSAHVAVHGCEPPRTVPTPLRLAAAGAGSVLDYVFVNDVVEVADARLAFDEVEGPLCASDHYGLVADLTLLPELAAVTRQ